MTKINEILAKEHNHEKILLVLMPYWPPLIPPLGIACLKSLLQEHGYSVKTVDANINESFRNIYNA
ncbi:MAG: hypothetical protein MUF15_23995 [Acidobacteria bacterium]|nr:hypothetical protein [Acidobacteriota bacterium]